MVLPNDRWLTGLRKNAGTVVYNVKRFYVLLFGDVLTWTYEGCHGCRTRGKA
jgi:hypothetical protein